MSGYNDFLIDCPNATGDLARAISASLPQKQPGLAIGAAISFFSLIKCGKLKSPQGVEPNMYICTVAESGSGKSMAQRILQNLLIDSGKDSLLLGKPASDSGMLKALSHQPIRLCIWDEFGLALGELATSQSSYRALILSAMMDLFSAAGRKYIGKEYATEQRLDVENPFLNVFAASTPSRFFQALDPNFVLDGFLSRWLLFFCHEEGLELQRPAPFIVTDKVHDQIDKMIEWPPCPTGNMFDVYDKRSVMVESAAVMESKLSDFDYLFTAAKDPIERIFYSRAKELFLKLCVILGDGIKVSNSVVEWSSQFVGYMTKESLRYCRSRLGEDKKYSTRDRFLDIVPYDKWITHQELTMRSYRLNLSKSQRNDLIDDLVESGYWAIDRQHVQSSNKKTTFYKRIRLS